jgi:hypothetical protein
VDWWEGGRHGYRKHSLNPAAVGWESDVAAVAYADSALYCTQSRLKDGDGDGDGDRAAIKEVCDPVADHNMISGGGNDCIPQEQRKERGTCYRNEALIMHGSDVKSQGARHGICLQSSGGLIIS